LYISTFVNHKDRAGFIDEPKTSLSLRKTGLTFSLDELLCVFEGIQRIRDMWGIYMDNEEDRLSLLVQGLVLRGRQIPLHSQNPYNPGRTQPDTIRIKVKNVPLSADDGQIHRALYLPI
jgi:hypothetical protein